METIQINKKNALKAHREADKKGKELLENLLGKEILSQKITDRIKTFEDALEIIKLSESALTLLKYNGVDKDMIGAQAMLKLTIIAKALNEGWEPDWSNSNEYKYTPYFSKVSSGFGFSGSDCADWLTDARCGSRLCFKSSELAMYAGKQFINIYNDFLTI